MIEENKLVEVVDYDELEAEKEDIEAKAYQDFLDYNTCFEIYDWIDKGVEKRYYKIIEMMENM